MNRWLPEAPVAAIQACPLGDYLLDLWREPVHEVKGQRRALTWFMVSSGRCPF